MRYLILILLVLCGCSAAPIVVTDDAGVVIEPQDDAEAPDAATTIKPDASKPKVDAGVTPEASTGLPSDCTTDGGFNASEWQQFCQELNAPKYAGCTAAIVCTDTTSMVSPETGCHWGGDGSQGRVWCCP